MSALRCRHCGFLPWLPREVLDEQCARCGYLRRPPAINGWQAFGIAAYAAMVERVEQLGGSRARIFPHGGNMMSFAVTAGLGLGGCEAYPGVFGAFGGYAEGMNVRDGLLNLPDTPGIGFERQPALFALMRELSA